MAATHRPNNDDKERDQRPINPIRNHPTVIRPHKQPQGQPWLNEPPPLGIDQMPTDRLTPQPGEHPAVRRQPVPSGAPRRMARKAQIKDRNNLHTIYKLSCHAFTKVSGHYEVEADIKMDGEIVLYSIAVGGQWRSVPFFLTHEAVQELLLADKDAAAYYGFPADDDDEGA